MEWSGVESGVEWSGVEWRVEWSGVEWGVESVTAAQCSPIQSSPVAGAYVSALEDRDHAAMTANPN